MKMDIVLTANENFAMPCGVCMLSIFENNKNNDIHVFIIYPDFSEKTISILKSISDRYNQSISFIKVDNDDDFKGINFERYSIVVTYRLILDKLLPQNIKKVLYLDCDIIVDRNISTLFNIADNIFRDYACAMVTDSEDGKVSLHNRIESDATYFNAGVMLVNLEYWRQNHISQLLNSNLKTNHKKYAFFDQDCINACLADKIYKLDYTFNFQVKFYRGYEHLQLHRSHFKRLNEIMEEGPAIIHYIIKDKPWFKESKQTPQREKFLYYYSISPWSKDPLKSAHSTRERVYFKLRRYLAALLGIDLKKIS